jgi:hypothetical protein
MRHRSEIPPDLDQIVPLRRIRNSLPGVPGLARLRMLRRCFYQKFPANDVQSRLPAIYVAICELQRGCWDQILSIRKKKRMVLLCAPAAAK